MREEIVCIIDIDDLPLMKSVDGCQSTVLYEDIVQDTQVPNFPVHYVSYCFSFPVTHVYPLFLPVIVLQLSSSQILNMGPVLIFYIIALHK